MALGTPTVTALKTSASAPLDLYRFVFLGDDYPGSGGFEDFQAFVRTALGRDVTIAYVKRSSPLKSENSATEDMIPTYDVVNDKLYFTLMHEGTEITGDDMSDASTIDLIVACY